MSGTISSAGISAARDNHIETVFSYLFFSIRKPGLLPGFLMFCPGDLSARKE